VVRGLGSGVWGLEFGVIAVAPHLEDALFGDTTRCRMTGVNLRPSARRCASPLRPVKHVTGAAASSAACCLAFVTR